MCGSRNAHKELVLLAKGKALTSSPWLLTSDDSEVHLPAPTSLARVDVET